MEETKTDYALMKETEQNKRALLREDKCDKYDYLSAVACGAVGGLVDSFLVGTPGDSVLGKWTDSQVDNAVKGFAAFWKESIKLIMTRGIPQMLEMLLICPQKIII